MQIFDDVAYILTVESVLERGHNAAASFQNSRADLSVRSGRSAGERRTLKNPVEHGRLFPHNELFSVVASATVHLKEFLATRDFLGASLIPQIRTARQRNGNESHEHASPKGSASPASHRIF